MVVVDDDIVVAVFVVVVFYWWSALYVSAQGPHSHILKTGGGGPTEVHILYPKKSQLQNLSTQKNPYFF